jgi:hypothetical protein
VSTYISRLRPRFRRRPRISTRVLAHAALLATLITSNAAAQPGGWSSVVEASASTLFGAMSQTLASLATTVSHDGQRLAADASMKFRYGESEGEDRNTFVSSRSWAATMAVDALPEGRVSPFILGSAEASLEKRIASRVSGGAGAKWVFAKSNTGKASVSVALLGERTAAMSDTLIPPSSVVRWSWRAKLDQRIDERLSFTHVTFYGPVLNAPGRYTVMSTSVGSYAINKAVALTMTFVDNYDSQARARGAPTNNDGSLLFGVRGAF